MLGQPVKHRKNEEPQQKKLARWLDFQFRGRWFHPPNGGNRDPDVGASMKMQGVKRGVSDVIITAPFDSYCGTVIELKAEKGALVIEQRIWLETFREAGFYVMTCWGANRAIKRLVDLYQRLPYQTPARKRHVCWGCMAELPEGMIATPRECTAAHRMCSSRAVEIERPEDLLKYVKKKVPKAKKAKTKTKTTPPLPPKRGKPKAPAKAPLRMPQLPSL